MAPEARCAGWESRVNTSHGPPKLQTHQGALAVGAGDALELVEGIHHDARAALQAAKDAIPFRHIRLVRLVALLFTSCLQVQDRCRTLRFQPVYMPHAVPLYRHALQLYCGAAFTHDLAAAVGNGKASFREIASERRLSL